MRALLAVLLLWAGAAQAFVFPTISTIQPLVASLDYQYLTGGAASWWYNNNVYGNTGYVNGVNYTQYGQANTGQMPTPFFMNWAWPDTGTGPDFGYPEVILGRGVGCSVLPIVNPFNKAVPGPQLISALNNLTLTYNITLGGNTQSYDILLDLYAFSVATPSDCTTLIGEISFYPQLYLPVSPTGTCHHFANYWAEVSSQTGGTGKPEIQVIPTNASCVAYQPMATANTSYTIDIKEIIAFCVTQGYMTNADYIQGLEFGAEPQTQNQPHSSTPHSGTLKINSLTYVWN